MSRRSLLCALLLAACAPSAAQAPVQDQWRALQVSAAPAALGRAAVGALVFRGGLALSADEASFGGLSGLEVMEDGRLIAVSDTGAWFSARLVLDAEGALVGLDETRWALMRDESGEPFATKRDGDAEGLTQLPDGRFAVSFEQTQTIRIYDLNRDGPFGAAAPGPALAETAHLPPNVGLEALAADEEGALIVGAEFSGALWRAPLGAGAAAAPLRLRYALSGGYALVGMDRLPDGGFVAIERAFAPILGARTRITRFAADALDAESETLDVELLAQLRRPLALDNFESIAAVRAPNGGVRLYIISDDNLSARQRTLLYAFDLADAPNLDTGREAAYN